MQLSRKCSAAIQERERNSLGLAGGRWSERVCGPASKAGTVPRPSEDLLLLGGQITLNLLTELRENQP